MTKRVEYATVRRAPNNTLYRFLLTRELGSRDAYSVITVVRVTEWYRKNEDILYREVRDNREALEFFQTLLDSFPRDQLYKE